MRSHPVVGSLFLLAAAALLVAGATAKSAPAFLHKLPLPPEVVVPFVLLQLAVWSLLFGLFFLRKRSGQPRGRRRAVPRV